MVPAPGREAKKSIAPVVMVAVATALRLAWVALVPSKPVGDFAMYLESAAHLVEHGALDPEFVYMPGYVFLLALVKAAGGGLLAAKVLGAVLGGLGAGVVYGLAHHLWDRRAALVASVLYTMWPAGIAVTSVTGTDLPAAVLIGLAWYLLVRWGGARPMLAAVLFGLVMGAAAWIRAVALPLVVLGAFYLRARGVAWPRVAKQTALAVAVAALVLAPWAVRNAKRYGEVFITDSHGGLTALVGANPNSEGTYSRSLNRIFHQATGYRLLAEPHRQADRAAYALARDWTAFEPVYAFGLAIAKAQRLLEPQRALLYWPIYRQGVLRPPHRPLFDGVRRELELVTDLFWLFLVGAAVFGLGAAAARRTWYRLALVPTQLALIAIYTLFFAEVRYQLPVALMLFPPAGAALIWVAVLLGRVFRRRVVRDLRREGLTGAVAVVAVFVGWWVLTEVGERLREGHRWAVHVGWVGQKAVACKWRRAADEDAPVVGVWNGAGVALVPGAAIEARIPVPRGRHRVRAGLDLAPLAALGGAAVPGPVWFAAGTAARTTVPVDQLIDQSLAGNEIPVELNVDHPGGDLVVRLGVDPAKGAAPPSTLRLWLNALHIDARTDGLDLR